MAHAVEGGVLSQFVNVPGPLRLRTNERRTAANQVERLQSSSMWARHGGVSRGSHSDPTRRSRGGEELVGRYGRSCEVPWTPRGTKPPRAAAEASHPLCSPIQLLPAELSQPVIADSKMVTDLVDHGPSYRDHHLFLVLTSAANWILVDGDAVWKCTGVGAASSERHTLVEAQDVVSVASIFDHDGDVGHFVAQLGGDRVQRVGHQFFESVARDRDHCAQDRASHRRRSAAKGHDSGRPVATDPEGWGRGTAQDIGRPGGPSDPRPHGTAGKWRDDPRATGVNDLPSHADHLVQPSQLRGPPQTPRTFQGQIHRS
jgi:hypothetical protein